jgi:hypothetical protein
MEGPKAMWREWLVLIGSIFGLAGPADDGEETLKHYYHKLCFVTHPDGESKAMDPREKERREHFFKIISGVCGTYTEHPEDMRPPDPAAFEADEETIDHDCDRASPPTPRTNHAGRRVYLVTFSHSESEGRRSPSEFSRRQFGELLVQAFEESVPNLRVEYSAVFRELHTAGTTTAARNAHFHVSIKSSRQHQWAPIADYLRRHHHIFSFVRVLFYPFHMTNLNLKMSLPIGKSG